MRSGDGLGNWFLCCGEGCGAKTGGVAVQGFAAEIDVKVEDSCGKWEAVCLLAVVFV